LQGKEERLNNLEEEDFYFIFFHGSLMPNYKKYERITMFNDVYYIENEIESEEYLDTSFVIKIKKLINNNIEKIENMDKIKSEKIKYPRSSSANKFHTKLNNKVYSVDRYLLNEEEKKEYDSFIKEIYGILGIKDERTSKLPELINEWRNKNDTESFARVIEQVKKTSFYCPIRIQGNGTKMMAIIRNSKGDSLLLAFTSREEAQKWNKNLTIKYVIRNFNQYADLLLVESNQNIGFVIDPYGANLALDKKIIRDIKNMK